MEKLYTCEEIAERYSVNTATVKEWIRRKELHAIKVNSKILRVRESDLIAFENARLTAE
nr:MAG TPA: helix-turn-helix domain protein [Caudoviricetes sp.]